MKTRLAPSTALEQEIAELLEQGITDSESIARLGRLGAQLVLQKGIEDEVAEFLQRVRYERTAQARGSRNGNRQPGPLCTFAQSRSSPSWPGSVA